MFCAMKFHQFVFSAGILGHDFDHVIDPLLSVYICALSRLGCLVGVTDDDNFLELASVTQRSFGKSVV